MVLALIGLAGAWWLLARYAPVDGGLYPPCPVNAATGLHCPGCGSGRALHALAHADFLAAFRYNALAMLFAGVVAPWAAWQAWLGLRHNRFARLRRPAATGWIILSVVLFFSVARNLPWPPFSWLAPNGSETSGGVDLVRPRPGATSS